MRYTLVKKIKKAVFPVGGLGTRFLPATKSLPKEMLPIANKPLIQHAFEEAVNAGIEEFIFITGRNKNAINNHFDNVFELEQALSEKEKRDALSLTKDWLPDPGSIVFIRQQYPLGLGHAVWCARKLIKDEPFAIILADELFITSDSKGLLSEMVTEYERLQSNLIAVAEVPKEDTKKYGIIKAKPNQTGSIYKIETMVEKPSPEEAPSNISIIGRYILHSEIFDCLAQTPKGSGGEIQLTDAMKAMLQKQDFYGYKLNGKRLDCGTPLGFFEANIEFALQDPSTKEQAKHIINRIVNQIK
jgi:UTP--glucose-1-phosphate uridylyltransferase